MSKYDTAEKIIERLKQIDHFRNNGHFFSRRLRQEAGRLRLRLVERHGMSAAEVYDI